DLICKDKREQKQSKTDKKRKRQVQKRNLKPIAKAGSADNKKRKSMKVKGSIMTSVQSSKALLDEMKSKDQSCQRWKDDL
ncbi:hypothetical protein Tco_1547047, partial [Tanacetum coccineum]